MIKKLARIKKARTEWKDRAVFNFNVFVDYEEFGSQMVGEKKKDRWSKDSGVCVCVCVCVCVVTKPTYKGRSGDEH